MQSLERAIDDYLGTSADWLIQFRRHLHANPEPSREEYRTTLEIAARLSEVHIPYRLVPTGRGLIAEPQLHSETPRVAIRADIDALRIHEQNDTPYRSTRDGVMHACGHDAHAAMALGAALALRHATERTGAAVPWRAIFQPAEETGEGADEMVHLGAMDGVSAIIALHVDPELEVGRAAHRPGVLTAYCIELKVVVKGRGGHAARPHQAIDPIAAAVQFVAAVYQQTPRTVDSRDAVVVTFGSIHGGEVSNAIPDRVDLAGTIRTLSTVSKERTLGAIRAIAAGIEAATGTTIEVAFLQGVAAVINDITIDTVLAETATTILGHGRVTQIESPSLGGEDFSAYLSRSPGALMRLGVATSKPWPPLHSPRFDIDERALVLGARILAHAVLRLASNSSNKELER